MYYSQCGEDKFLFENYFKDLKNGIYIELGAHDGITQSNTKFFEDSLGWTGILVEPHPNIFTKLKENRPNNYLFNDLVSSETKELNYTYLNGIELVGGVKESLSEMHYKQYYEKYENHNILIKPKTLTEIVKSTGFDHIDFFSLDTEGHELEVLQSYDFSIPINLILIETLGVEPEKDEKCRQFLLSKGYKFSQKCAHNEIYVLHY